MQLIREFMKSPVISIDSQSDIQAASMLMRDKHISSVLVQEGTAFIGIITKSDLVDKVLAEGLNPKDTKVKSAMSSPLITLDQYSRRSEAYELMRQKQIKHLVVTLGRDVVGILTLENMV